MPKYANEVGPGLTGIRNLNVWWEPIRPMRFVEREVDGRQLRILQQLWARIRVVGGGSPAPTGDHEWRDVPLQAEDRPVTHGDWTLHESLDETKLIDDLKLMKDIQGEH